MRRTAQHEERQMARRPHPTTMRDAAIRYASHGIPVLPDQLTGQSTGPTVGMPVCSCRRRDCPAQPIHRPRTLDRTDPTPPTSHLGRWWTATPNAAIATVTGAAFDVIEIHTAIPPDRFLNWLADQGHKPGPALYAGLGRVQLLAAPDSYQHDRYDSAAAAILYLAPGSLILLPPSRLNDGHSVTWLRPLDPSADLPNGADLFWALLDVPTSQQLADPDVYTFPAPLRQRDHARSPW
jgi:Bifunctional DNA primase/polymerase, N-terminal